MRVDDYMREAVDEAAVPSSVLHPPESELIRKRVGDLYDTGRGGRALWQRLGVRSSVQHESAWRWIPEIIGDGACHVFFDSFRSDSIYRLETARDLVSVLAHAYGFEFYVTNEAAEYLVAFNDHDFLIACGSVREGLVALVPQISLGPPPRRPRVTIPEITQYLSGGTGVDATDYVYVLTDPAGTTASEQVRLTARQRS